MAKYDPEREAHKAWLNAIQPIGVVVAPPALTKAGLVLARNVIDIRQRLLAVVTEPEEDDVRGPALLDVPRFVTEVLGWEPGDLAGAPGAPAVPERLAVHLPDHGEILRPTYAAIDEMDGGKVLMLVQVVDRGPGLDRLPAAAGHTGWHATPQARFERLLRDTKVPAGLLLDGDELRLVYAPEGESSGYLSFPVSEMCKVSGGDLLGAMHMLLCEARVFGDRDDHRLLDLLAESRKYQNEVSTKLASQVLSGLWELLRGFQAADEAARGGLLLDIPHDEPEQIYGGLLTVIMRLVFLLYAEDQGLMPDDPVYARNYAVGGLFERLREDAGRYPDTMDQRFGAYAWLLSTFRMVFDGGAHGGLRIPTRHGQLFNPDEYPFLEGRTGGTRVVGVPFEVPRVSDGVIWRVLEDLLILDGERLSYRALDVEQIGSVYESMMGFDVTAIVGRAIAVRPKNIVIDIDELLKLEPGKRAAWLKEHAECELADRGGKALKDARTAEDVVAALGKKVSAQTPIALPRGALVLQPGEERRRSGSHYTPRELTEPIVRTTLRPVLEALGPKPTPAQILDLKVCDPAMGSGAFLVETCRQLAVALVAAWEAHGLAPSLPPDEPAYLHARRLVAQRCLYGVDKNPFAVSLAKLSLWLVTLAKDHAFTFLDHALKHGDSLVGLTKNQIGAFHWDPPEVVDSGPLFKGITADIQSVTGWRAKIQALGEGDYDARRQAWLEGEEIIREVRMLGDLCVAAYFEAERDRERDAARVRHQHLVDLWKGNGDRTAIERIVHELRADENPLVPFHWQIEFPEVFGRNPSGFDAIIGNPPFLGGVKISASFGDTYLDYVKRAYSGTGGQADLVACFFRRSFDLLRQLGSMGLVATNTISQGDTRRAALLPIRRAGGTIYNATKRCRWPGESASVVVSLVHVQKGKAATIPHLNGKPVDAITTYLFHRGPDEDPRGLRGNRGLAFKGLEPYADGFVFEDGNSDAFPLAKYRELWSNPHNRPVLHPYLNGKELNTQPQQVPSRFAVNFEEMSLAEALQWPEIVDIIATRIQAQRATKASDVAAWPWWKYWRSRPDLMRALRSIPACLAIADTSTIYGFSRVPSHYILNKTLVVVALDSGSAFTALQSRCHELWARFFASSLEDRVRYLAYDCFETFPFPMGWQSDPTFEAVGKAYYDYRAALMAHNNEGLTKTYHRFNNPEDDSPEIVELRRLHAVMDRTALDAYGWTDIPTECDFLLDYAIDEDNWGRKKKPWRYRWPDAVHDEVLARLLVLNQQRYDEEVAAGLHRNVPKAREDDDEDVEEKPAKSTKPMSKSEGAKSKATKKGAKGAKANLSLFDGAKEDSE